MAPSSATGLRIACRSGLDRLHADHPQLSSSGCGLLSGRGWIDSNGGEGRNRTCVADCFRSGLDRLSFQQSQRRGSVADCLQVGVG